MNIFKDYYNNKVKLSFEDHPFTSKPKHVWVICKYKDHWLLTKHKERGLEFPGGKVEIGETAVQAAEREVMEETGGKIAEMKYIGQYFVSGKKENVIKNVYFAVIDELFPQPTYFETEGPVLLETLPNDVKHNRSYSFIMKDDVLVHCMKLIKNRL
ncbi:RNA deprotection pyrophosphohydrolase [Virgibacillus sp. SK37]|uniref:RNA deprotection pyrophosphohydrolase n=1 Tax=Virgibacillus sp. SK37 TaxID=403957 RepID=UPI0004D10D9E|nr:nucleoside triphosphatase YtkD [Virgibacillus sp. SK37]AIF43993.1 7,8-dihydro-8-oxoguanine-triphosphatase [Virgibacillus sp. SK37]